MIRLLGNGILGAVVMLAFGCDSAYLFSDAAVSRVRQESVEKHRKLAAAREADGDLRGALEEWRVVGALVSDPGEPRDKIRALQKQIDKRASFHMKAATDALARARLRSAKSHLLKVLALKPGEKSAGEMLREVERRRVAAGLAVAPMHAATSATGAGHPHVLPSHGSGYAEEQPGSARGDRRKETAAPAVSAGQASLGAGGEAAMTPHMRRALAYRAENKLEKSLEHLLKAKENGEAANFDVDYYLAEVKTALAEQFYREGVRRFRTDLDESIKAFERALSYYPEHDRARHYLSTAVRLRQQREESAPMERSAR